VPRLLLKLIGSNSSFAQQLLVVLVRLLLLQLLKHELDIAHVATGGPGSQAGFAPRLVGDLLAQVLQEGAEGGQQLRHLGGQHSITTWTCRTKTVGKDQHRQGAASALALESGYTVLGRSVLAAHM
jgi:hypothetical protein